MLIERSADFGRTWRPYRYFAYNCTKTFPQSPANGLLRINHVICEERYSDIEPSTEGEVIYKVLDPAIPVEDPYSLEIQELLRITNLRINFTKLHTLGDNLLDRRAHVLQKYYYALYELVVRGSCFCYGHASECAPVPGVQARDSGMIHGRCVCKHNTEECQCNGHSSQCHFDMAVFLSTGGVSGGVCEACLHHTVGRSCDMCEPFYYKDPSRDIRDPQVCIACDCDPVGSLEGGVCDSHSDLDAGRIAGQCRCKANVKGSRCDVCREGFYGLSQDHPLGCQPCNCDPRGIIQMGVPCDQISGDCSCKRYVTGRYCNQCLPEYWGLSNDLAGCRSCDCDFGGALNNRRQLIGRQCSEVKPGFFCAPLDFSRYEAEDATGHAPDDSSLPGTARPQAEVDCVEHLNNQLQRQRRHRRIATAQQQRAALRRIRQLQQTPDVRPVYRERSLGHMVTWSGPGFSRVKDGAGLVFVVDDVPHAMEYDIMVRYEPESTEDWEVVVSVTSVMLASSHRCGNLLPTEQLYTVTLPHRKRYPTTPLLHPSYTPPTSLLHPSYTPTTPYILHPSYTPTTPLLHPYYTPTTPLLHPYYTPTTPLLHPSYTPTTPLLHPYYTPPTPLLHPYYTPPTPLLHPSYTPTTPLLHPSYTPTTPLLHPSYTPPTPLLHPYYTPTTPLLHPYYTPTTPLYPTPYILHPYYTPTYTPTTPYYTLLHPYYTPTPLHPYYTPPTPLLHPYYTPPTPLLHPSYTPTTPLLHPSYTPTTPLLHPSTPLLHPYYTLLHPYYTLLHPYYTPTTPLLYPYYTPPTPLLHPYYTPPTPLLHPYYTPIPYTLHTTPLLHPYYTLHPTPLLHPYCTPPTPLLHPYYTPTTPYILHPYYTPTTPYILHPSYTPTTPLLHPSYTPTTPLLHPYYTPPTPLLHPYYTPPTPLLHPYYTPPTPLLHPYYTPPTLLLHPYYTPTTPLLHPYYTPPTPLLHSSYTPTTPLLHPYYTLHPTPLLYPYYTLHPTSYTPPTPLLHPTPLYPTPLLHPYYTPPTPLLHPYYTPPTPLLHPYYTPTTPLYPTPLLHPYYTPTTPLLHPYYTPIPYTLHL
ncbi:hypothetical protein NHX12_013228 [Muraenolepis orangiensis]|uniref:Laminin subunit beta-2-like n=1 Tax=Muraenolepis orangiensis TaxID=630683 RepID=A0A9Q0DEG2_9TELE|nr:hypothetical protein NHX12_013228 [Muraenolepis orangiensis]